MALSWSSTRLFCCPIESVVEEIYRFGEVNDSLKNEDQAYLSNVFTHTRLSQQFMQLGQYEMCVFHAKKAQKVAEQLYKTRKDKN
mmetsp:Transcript_2765/g.4730  ORF Transcript_2765/g.4730 Transcript_2765/m.4730 type:complete len:85 (+) Transcript_2765:141-395(+)